MRTEPVLIFHRTCSVHKQATNISSRRSKINLAAHRAPAIFTRVRTTTAAAGHQNAPAAPHTASTCPRTGRTSNSPPHGKKTFDIAPRNIAPNSLLQPKLGCLKRTSLAGIASRSRRRPTLVEQTSKSPRPRVWRSRRAGPASGSRSSRYGAGHPAAASTRGGPRRRLGHGQGSWTRSTTTGTRGDDSGAANRRPAA